MEAYLPGIWYNFLPYKYPLDQSQPVIRIPVAGPAPYNTLAIVRSEGHGYAFPAVGELYRVEGPVPTPLILRGYDPLRESQQSVLHSSTGTIYMLQNAAGDGPQMDDWNVAFTVAIDSISPEATISDTGQVFINIATAAQSNGEEGCYGVSITSYILCWEPPDPDEQTDIRPSLKERDNPSWNELLDD